MNVDGTNMRQLTNNSHRDLTPGWSPDGTQIIYASDQDGDFEVFVMNSDGSNVRQLTNDTYLNGIGGQSWLSQTPSKGSVLFDDVPAGHWADEEIGWAVSKRIIASVSDTTFGLNDTVTRAEIVTLLYTAVNAIQDNVVTTVSLGSDTFNDVLEGHEADRQIGWAVANGITSGVGQGLFDPGGTVTRAQIVTFLYRLTNLLESD